MTGQLSSVNPFFTLAPWVIYLPALGLLVNLLVGKRLGRWGAGIVASLAAFSAFVVSLILAFALGGSPQGQIVPVTEWMQIGDFVVNWALKVDTLSVTMMLVVSGVGTIIHVYATGYMDHDVHHQGDPQRYSRFFIYFNLFILCMMVLVSADNYLMLFAGWEGGGLCSYLLIGFWFEKGKNGLGNARAAKKAFVVNRIGDFGLLIALFIIFWYFGSFDYQTVFMEASQSASVISGGVILTICLLMLLAVAGKSAQLPLYVWLPDAMAGPTPVSALIHAATMVTAGVYLIARSTPLFILAPVAQETVLWVGALTALFAATIALGQNDIKKVLAYSTVSQLGYMVAAVGIGAVSAAMFHLITHAFFKALLFLAAGSVILGMEKGIEEAHEQTDLKIDPQDMRNMGGLASRMPVTFWVFLIGGLVLSGVPPLAGFFSKDEILLQVSHHSLAAYIVLLAGAFLTAFYVCRQLLMVFSGRPRTQAAAMAEENPKIITVPLMVLAGLSVLGGLINFPSLEWLHHWLSETVWMGETAAFSWLLAGLSVLVVLIGLFVGWLVYGSRSLGSPDRADPLTTLGWIYQGMDRKWWVDEIYTQLFIRPFRFFSCEILAVWQDQEVIDGGVNDLGLFFSSLSRAWSKLQDGFIRTYGLMMLFGLTLMLALILLR